MATVLILSVLIGSLCLGYLTHTVLRVWRERNPYRFAAHMAVLPVLVAVLLLVETPLIEQADPSLVSPTTQIVVLFLMNTCQLVAGSFSLWFGELMLHGVADPRVRRHRQVLLLVLVTVLGVMGACYVRAGLLGEHLTNSWFAEHPADDRVLSAGTLVCIAGMIAAFWRILSFCRLYVRVTPLPHYKTGNAGIAVAATGSMASYGLDAVCLFIPAGSLLALVLTRIIYLDVLLVLVAFTVSAQLLRRPGQRWRRFGAWLWSVRTVWRIAPLWRDLTTVLPEVVLPPSRSWLSALVQRELSLFGEARLIAIFDALYRLGVPLTATTPPESATPFEQAQDLERSALRDACEIVLALRAYSPGREIDRGSVQANPIAILTHQPSMSWYEAHALESIARAYQWVRHHPIDLALQPASSAVSNERLTPTR